MKKEYIVPEIEVITFDDGDILTNSQLIFVPGGNATDKGNEGFIGWGGSNVPHFNVDVNEVQNIMDK